MLSKVRQINWEMIKQDSEMLNTGASKIEDVLHFFCSRGVSAPWGGVCSREVSAPWGVCSWGVSAPGGVCS